MQSDNLGVIERKVLGALLILCNENNEVTATTTKIAQIIGYKASGGALSFALRILEMNNFIVKTGERSYQVLI